MDDRTTVIYEVFTYYRDIAGKIIFSAVTVVLAFGAFLIRFEDEKSEKILCVPSDTDKITIIILIVLSLWLSTIFLS